MKQAERLNEELQMLGLDLFVERAKELLPTITTLSIGRISRHIWKWGKCVYWQLWLSISRHPDKESTSVYGECMHGIDTQQKVDFVLRAQCDNLKSIIFFNQWSVSFYQSLFHLYCITSILFFSECWMVDDNLCNSQNNSLYSESIAGFSCLSFLYDPREFSTISRTLSPTYRFRATWFISCHSKYGICN